MIRLEWSIPSNFSSSPRRPVGDADLRSVVLWGGSCWPLGGDIGLGHAAVNDKVVSVDKAALVACQEDHGMGLFNRLAEPARREMDLAPLALGLVIAEPVLEQRGVEGSWAEVVEAEALSRVYNGEL